MEQVTTSSTHLYQFLHFSDIISRLSFAEEPDKTVVEPIHTYH